MKISILFLFLFIAICSLFAQEKAIEPKIKISLNAYSFNAMLSSGEMDLDDLLNFCAKTGFDAIDITAYYFPGYPEVPSDEVLFAFKRKAFELGLEISGTGVKNDFTSTDPKVIEDNIQLVKNWIIAAQKLGAPVLRIFSGQSNPGQFENKEVFETMIGAIQECVEFGAAHGIVVAIQNHWQLIKHSEHVKAIFNRIDSPWFGLILDVGSYRMGDPYKQIEETIPYTVNWQLKEMVYVDGKPVKTDVKRIMELIRESSYRGYVPIETLGEGDYKQKVRSLYKEVVAAMNIINHQ